MRRRRAPQEAWTRTQGVHRDQVGQRLAAHESEADSQGGQCEEHRDGEGGQPRPPAPRAGLRIPARGDHEQVGALLEDVLGTLHLRGGQVAGGLQDRTDVDGRGVAEPELRQGLRRHDDRGRQARQEEAGHLHGAHGVSEDVQLGDDDRPVVGDPGGVVDDDAALLHHPGRLLGAGQPCGAHRLGVHDEHVTAQPPGKRIPSGVATERADADHLRAAQH